jgi:hypothetical protein
MLQILHEDIEENKVRTSVITHGHQAMILTHIKHEAGIYVKEFYFLRYNAV